MLLKNRLFTPGPTPLLPAAQNAMAAFTAHHRTADFRALFTRVLADMKDFIGTANDVLVIASSGTGVMEGSVSNLTSPGDKVLVLTAGKFGERWRDLTNAYGCTVDVLEKPYGETFSLDEVRAKLGSETKAVYVQATESSTGARHDVKGIAKLVRANGDDTLLIVDAITGLGTTHFDVDGWGIDVIIGGSQKALMIPPGLAYCAISERAWKRMETAKNPRYYFDFRKERKAAAKGESAFTPATSLFAALGAALDFIRQMGSGDLVAGRKALVDNAELAAEMTRAGVKALGLKLFRSETAKNPRYYFDFRKERKAAAKGESAFTPATSLFAALGAALDFIRQMGSGDLVAGRKALVDNAELAAEMTRAGVKALGLKLF